MNKTKRHTVRFGLIAMVLALIIVVPSLLKYGASAASSTAKPGKVTLTNAKSTAYNKATIYWKKRVMRRNIACTTNSQVPKNGQC